MVRLNLAQFLNDSWMVDWQATKLAKTACSLLVFVHLDEISRCLGQEEKSSDQLASAIAYLISVFIPTYPPTRMIDQRNCTAMGMRYDPES